MSYIDTTVVFSEFYESNYGIFNHLDPHPHRPLASVALHECEENSNTSELKQLFLVYAKSNVRKTFGISLNEFLGYPKEMVRWMVEISAEQVSKTPQLPKLE